MPKPFDPTVIQDAKTARDYLNNVRRLGRTDLYPAAFRRLCELSGQPPGDNPPEDVALVADFWRAIAALEEILRDQHGKVVRASRTRQKVKRVGVRKTVEDLALSKQESEGFRILTEHGLGDLTAEYLVLKHVGQFSDNAVAAARLRLEAAAVALPGASA
ncbi:hypothetical protein [Azospirillum sp. TSH100]|uniref:hypothetical protein n=1 Tax=Azospirillum sp. TSH100 TaxID=652764 RepID=UPI0011B22D12|nr:hypothetical protein [Azospirillum sp. TSH100]